ncbi:MAG: PGN_0703 family putative restriction endonuclease [Burkholderiales bacterium]
MDDYKAAQLNAQLAFLAASETFSEDARVGGGMFRGKPRAFVLPPRRAEENLFPPIRASVRDYFARHVISWHMANAHLLSSQVCCLNFLEPFASEPRALRILLQNILGPIDEMLEPEPDSDPERFVAFEFIGARDYLNEGGKRGRTRGAKCTSVDAAVRLRTPSGSVEFALIEWKYTELYSAPDPFDSSNGERMRRYEKIAFHPDGPLRADCGMNLVEFFAEPIYQLLRQQMLAMQMEKFQELEAKRVRTVLIAPSGNVALTKLRINALRQFGTDVPSAWRALLYDPNRFKVCPTEVLFRYAQAAIRESHRLEAWESYFGERYSLR